MPMVSPLIRTSRSWPSTTLMPLRVEKPCLPVVTGIVRTGSPLRVRVSSWVAASTTLSTRSPVLRPRVAGGPPYRPSEIRLPSPSKARATFASAGQ